MSINRAIPLGNVGRDPEMRSTQAGDKVASFSLATSKSYRDKATGERKEIVEWHNIVVFNQAIAGTVEQYVKKGTRLLIEGSIKTRKYTDRDGNERRATDIVIDRFDGSLSLEGQPQGAQRNEGDYGTTRDRPSTTTSQRQPDRDPAPIDDDIPF